MILRSFLAHLQARNLAPTTLVATEEFLRPFLSTHDPLSVSKRDIELYLADMATRCKPSTVWTTWRHLRSLFAWLHAEGDIDCNPMDGIRKPLVPPAEIVVLNAAEIRRLLATCTGRTQAERRDLALLTLMLDTGLRLAEVARLSPQDISGNQIRVFGKGRKWRTVALGTTASRALGRWTRLLPANSPTLWPGTKGPLTPTGIRKLIAKRGHQAGLTLHPHQLRHTFVDNWLRNGGAEVDLARLCGWTTTRMAERYAQHLADERAITSHKTVAPLDRVGN